MFVRLRPTAFHKDYSQLTVPFFDLQPVTTTPASWLEGIEIYHRGSKGFGGFIAFQILHYNISKLLLNEETEAVYNSPPRKIRLGKPAEHNSTRAISHIEPAEHNSSNGIDHGGQPEETNRL